MYVYSVTKYASSQNGCRRELKQTPNLDTELAFCIRKYLLHRGQVWMPNLATLWPMSATVWKAAKSQDKIGWIEFLHGKVSTTFRGIQHAHCITAGTQISGNDWMIQFTWQ